MSEEDDLFPKSRPSEFDTFWSIWPRKDAKEDARKAWLQVTAGKDKADPKIIIDGAKRYAEHWRDKGTPRHYIPLPASWLRGRRWGDEVIQPKRSIDEVRGDFQKQFDAKYKWIETPFGMRKVRIDA